MKKSETSVHIVNIRTASTDISDLDALVKDGMFMSRSDAARYALRRGIATIKSERKSKKMDDEVNAYVNNHNKDPEPAPVA